MVQNDSTGYVGCLLVALMVAAISLVIAFPYIFLIFGIVAILIVIISALASSRHKKRKLLTKREEEEHQGLELKITEDQKQLELEKNLEQQQPEQDHSSPSFEKRQATQQRKSVSYAELSLRAFKMYQEQRSKEREDIFDRIHLKEKQRKDQEELERQKRAHEAALYEKAMLRARISEVDTMNGIEFEEYLASLFKRLGYSVELTPTSNDFGADLILNNGMRKIVVQAKCYSKPVANSAVQEVHGALVYYKAHEAWVVTNSIFTANAVQLANSLKVALIDRHSLIELAEEAHKADADEGSE